MKAIIKYLSAFVVLLFFICPANGQSFKVIRRNIHFESGKYNLSPESMTIIDQMMDSVMRYSVENTITNIQVNIEGYTDNKGSLALNKRLSEQRDSAAIKYLLTKPNIHSDNIKAMAMGLVNPIDDNSTAAGRAQNRRAEITISYKQAPIMDLFEPKSSIFDLYKQLEIRPQEFCINPKRDTVLRCLKGTIVYVKAGSFKQSDSCSSNCVTIKVKEDFLKSEMILDNLSTTSNGQLLESRGMVYTEADDCRGKKLSLLPGKDMVIFVPTDTIVPNVKIFDGERNTGDSVMNWTPSGNSVLTNISLKEIARCQAWVKRGGCQICCDGPCRFFFCRIKRIGLSIKGLFVAKTRKDNRNFRSCNEQRKIDIKQALKQRKAPPKQTIINLDPTMPASLIPKCKELDEQCRKYGVKNIDDLLYAMNKPLMDSFKVKSVAALYDTLAKKDIDNIEMAYLNKKLAFKDFKYYVYKSNRMGWSNCDIFANVPANKMVNIKVDLNVNRDIDCKLVFKKRRATMPADTLNNTYGFNKVPKNEEVWIVALKYAKGQPFLSVQETRIKADKVYSVDFKAYTLEALKKELRKLDD